jgi:hypothetical protein
VAHLRALKLRNFWRPICPIQSLQNSVDYAQATSNAKATTYYSATADRVAQSFSFEHFGAGTEDTGRIE